LSDDHSRFEIVTPDWQLSFQRHVGVGVGSNRGALPYFRLRSVDGRLRVLVPLPAGEALWIAWMLRPGGTVSGSDADGNALHIAPVTQSGERWSLFAADALEHAEGRRSLDSNSFALARTRKAVAQDHLRFEVQGKDAETLHSVGIVLATPALYARLSGQPAPSPSAPSEAYTGWRLP
jgi:hypothetical protein